MALPILKNMPVISSILNGVGGALGLLPTAEGTQFGHSNPYLQRQGVVVQRAILPHLDPSEGGGLLRALSEFETKAPRYWEGFQGKPMELSPESRAALDRALKTPGYSGALGVCATCMQTALTGVPTGFDIGENIFSTNLKAIPPDKAPEKGLGRYHGIAPGLRAHFTNQILHIEQVLGRILDIKPEDLTPAMLERLRSSDIDWLLNLTLHDLEELLFEHKTLAMLLYSTVQNILFRKSSDSVVIYRIHINMTTINELGNELGSLYLKVVTGWLQDNVGKLLSVRNPEGTTYEIVAMPEGAIRSSLRSFNSKIKHMLMTSDEIGEKDRKRLQNFVPKVIVSQRTLSLDNIFKYAIQTKEDIEAFGVVLRFFGLDVEKLLKSDLERSLKEVHQVRPALHKVVEPVNGGVDKAVVKTAWALITKALTELNKVLAAQTSFFEKEDRRGMTVYSEEYLPKAGSPLYKKWQRNYLKKNIGYVGPGKNHPESHYPQLAMPGVLPPSFIDVGLEEAFPLGKDMTAEGLSEQVNIIRNATHSYNRLIGELSHRRYPKNGTPGSQGAIETFLDRMGDLIKARPDKITNALADLQKAARKLLNTYRLVYLSAITYPRNAWYIKQHHKFEVQRGNAFKWVPADFFVQEIAQLKNRYIIALEVDSLRAYSLEHGKQDFTDSDYHSILTSAFLAAQEMKMPMPIINPAAGDNNFISFSDKDIYGKPIDPIKYCKLMSSIVDKMFKNRKFQDLMKVNARNYRLEGPNLKMLLRGKFREQMRRDLGLAAQPEITEENIENKGDIHIILAVELNDRSGRPITLQKITDYLIAKNIDIKGKELGIEKLRLLMWKKIRKIRSTGNIERFVYGSISPKGHKKYMQTLSISMALAEHRAIKYASDMGEFNKTLEFVNEEMHKVKDASWPEKGGFKDARTESPMYRKIAQKSPINIPPTPVEIFIKGAQFVFIGALKIISKIKY